MSERRDQRAKITRILGEIRDPPGRDAVRRVMARLREGAGEERLVELLAALETKGPPRSSEALVSLARALFTIGIRPQGRGWRKRTMGADICTIFEVEVPFCWGCTCGFRLCQVCLEENRWGFTCNNVTWECPDCGAFRSF